MRKLRRNHSLPESFFFFVKPFFQLFKRGHILSISSSRSSGKESPWPSCLKNSRRKLRALCSNDCPPDVSAEPAPIAEKKYKTNKNLHIMESLSATENQSSYFAIISASIRVGILSPFLTNCMRIWFKISR